MKIAVHFINKFSQYYDCKVRSIIRERNICFVIESSTNHHVHPICNINLVNISV